MATGRLFISYRRDDSKYASKLIHERLVAKFGRGRVFIDVVGLEGGIDFLKAIQEKVSACDVCVAVIGERWVTSVDSSGARRLDNPNDLLRAEIARSLESDDTAVIPCLLDGAELPPEALLPGDLRPLASRQVVRVNYTSFDRDILALIRAIHEAFVRATRRRRQERLDRWRRRLLVPLAEFAGRKPVISIGIALLFCATAGAGIYAFGTRPVFAARMLLQAPPGDISNIWLPARGPSYASPRDWRDEILYSILADRFSDGAENKRQMLTPENTAAARGNAWNGAAWMTSGESRWQGGTIAGIRSKLDYLAQLGVSAIIISPLARQSGSSYLGYSPQDFVDVDPHFGTRRDLVNLISDAHRHRIRVILTALLLYTGPNWNYPSTIPGGFGGPPYSSVPYPFGNWLDADGRPVQKLTNRNEGVWPREFQDPDVYYRQGTTSFSGGPDANKGDFPGLRRLRFSKILQPISACYKYWIALTDCDGLYLDAFGEIPIEDAHSFARQIKSYAATLGKSNFLMIGDIYQGEDRQAQYLARLGGDLDAVLDLRGASSLRAVGAGDSDPVTYFQSFSGESPLQAYRYEGKRTILPLDIIDGFTGRLSGGAGRPNLIVAGTAFQLLTPGIPCLYYGDEQSFSEDFSSSHSTQLSREAMFGPVHPRKPGKDGLASGDGGLDVALPGFGPSGSSGWHAFNTAHPAYVRIAALASARQKYTALRQGGLGALRSVSMDGIHFGDPPARSLVAWTRSAGQQTVLCIVNLNATQPANAQVSMDSATNETGSVLTVVANTMHAAEGQAYKGSHPVTSHVTVEVNPDGVKFIAIKSLGPYEVLVLAGNPVPEDTDFGQVANYYRQNPYGYGSTGYNRSRKRP